METKVNLQVNGQEVSQSDFNTVAEEAALTSDWLLADLLRPSTQDNDISFAYKYVIPAGGGQENYQTNLDRKPIVTTSVAANSKVFIRPFTALVGPRTSEVTDPKLALRDIRTARHYGVAGAGFKSEMQLAAATAGRIDLIYARVDVDLPDASVQRYVKTGPGAATSSSQEITKQTTLTLGVVQGVDGGPPARPALPADAAGAYYIALAYVQLAASHTLTTQIKAHNIHEVYDPSHLASALGVSRLRPANGCYTVGGNSFTQEAWNATYHPNSHLPPGMVGGESIFVPIGADDSTTPSVPPNTTVVLDSSCDWRKRCFKITYQVILRTGQGFPWSQTVPSAGFMCWQNGQAYVGAGQSFLDDATYFTGVVAGGTLLFLTAATTPALASSAQLAVFVDLTTGQLKCWRNNFTANRMLFLWIEATAPYMNNDNDGN